MHSLEPPYAHNDVKPGNVLLTRRKGQPPLAILMDFGSARPSRKQIRSRQEALQLQVLYPSLILYPSQAFEISPLHIVHRAINILFPMTIITYSYGS